MRKARRIAPWILLAAYLPLVLASLLHTHRPPEEGATACPDCVKHVCHPAHFSNTDIHSNDCLLCHILTVEYFGSIAAVIIATPFVVGRPVGFTWFLRNEVGIGLSQLRAPPIY